MPFTDYARDKILGAIFAGVSDSVPTTQYWAGFTSAPSVTGGGTEASYTSYARASLTATTAHWPSASTSSGNTTISNSPAITWPQMTGGSTAVWTAFGFYDALSSGNLWMYGSIPSGQQPSVANGTSPQIAASGFTFTLNEASGSNGGFTDYAHQAILNRVFARVSIPITSLNLAAFTSAPSTSGGGTESTRSGYARVNIPQNLTNWPAASGSGTTSIANAIADAFGQLGGSGTETWVAWGIYDASSSGNLWIWGPLVSPYQLSVGNGSIPTWPISSLVAEMIAVS